MVKLQKKPYFGSINNNPNSKKMKKLIFLISVLTAFSVTAQRFPEARYFYGIKGGVNFFNINSDDIEFKSGTGFNAAFTRRLPLAGILEANVYAEFQQSNFSANTVDLLSSNSSSVEVDYKLQSVKLGALLNLKAYGPYFSVLLGPVIQFNDKLKYDSEQEDYILATIVEGTDSDFVTVDDVSKISGFNFNVAAGISTGDINYKVYGLYEYGINNIMSSINLNTGSITGHTSLFTVGAIVYF